MISLLASVSAHAWKLSLGVGYLVVIAIDKL
jgi:hypothetical protein